MSQERIATALQEAAEALRSLQDDAVALGAVERAAALMAAAVREGGKVVACGNGGSMCDAMHFAEELTGRYRNDRAALPAVAISDPAHITCVANDFGFDQVFSRFVEAHGRKGDVLLAISTSGSSPNVLNAADAARAREMTVVALTGSVANPLADRADVHIATPGGRYSDRVQELNIKVLHILVELIEDTLV